MSEPLLNYYDYEVLCNKLPIHEIHIKNDDSVKEAPAFCRSFLDSLYK